jgi:hypothetical protein
MTQNQPPRPVHVPGTTKGEELALRKGREPGREEAGSRSYRSSRDSTGINAKDRAPIDPRSPSIPPA